MYVGGVKKPTFLIVVHDICNFRHNVLTVSPLNRSVEVMETSPLCGVKMFRLKSRWCFPDPLFFTMSFLICILWFIHFPFLHVLTQDFCTYNFPVSSNDLRTIQRGPLGTRGPLSGQTGTRVGTTPGGGTLS